MKALNDKHKISATLILAGLWLINILIVVFGSPFLIVNKIKAFFGDKTDKFAPREDQTNSTNYLPRQIDSKL